MATLRCNTCDGTYDEVLPDGMRYFHRCPPLSVPELKAAREAGRLALSPSRALQLTAAEDADRTDPVAPGSLSRVEQFFGTLRIDRPFMRDENVVPDRDRQTEGTPKADGTGTTELAKSVIGDGAIRG